MDLCVLVFCGQVCISWGLAIAAVMEISHSWGNDWTCYLFSYLFLMFYFVEEVHSFLDKL